MTKKLIVILVLGVFFRLILAAITYHSDLAPYDLAGMVVRQGHLLDFYDYLPSLPEEHQILKTFPPYLFNYPPAIYFSQALFTTLTASLVGSDFISQFLFNVKEVLGSSQLWWHVLLLKLPYLVFDLPIAWLLASLFKVGRMKLLGFSFWMFNPINLYTTYMVGQFDVIPTFFVVAALAVAVHRKNWWRVDPLFWAALLLGLGAAYKIYPLLLLIPLSSVATGWGKRLLIVMMGAVPYLLSVLPFLSSPGYQATSLLASQTLKSLYPQIAVSGGESILLFLATLIFFYWLFVYLKSQPEALWSRFLIVLLIFFIFTHFHPQWFLWVVPLMLIELVSNNFRNLLVQLMLLAVFIGMVFFFDPGLNIGLFSAIWPALYNSPSLWQLVSINIDYNFARSILQTILVGSAAYLIYYYFPRTNQHG